MTSREGIARQFHQFLNGKLGEKFTREEIRELFKNSFTKQAQYIGNEDVPSPSYLYSMLVRHHLIIKCAGEGEDNLHTYGDGRKPRKQPGQQGGGNYDLLNGVVHLISGVTCAYSAENRPWKS